MACVSSPLDPSGGRVPDQPSSRVQIPSAKTFSPLPELAYGALEVGRLGNDSALRVRVSWGEPNFVFAGLFQRLECLFYKEKVGGSSPSPGTSNIRFVMRRGAQLRCLRGETGSSPVRGANLLYLR